MKLECSLSKQPRQNQRQQPRQCQFDAVCLFLGDIDKQTPQLPLFCRWTRVWSRLINVRNSSRGSIETWGASSLAIMRRNSWGKKTECSQRAFRWDDRYNRTSRSKRSTKFMFCRYSLLAAGTNHFTFVLRLSSSSFSLIWSISSSTSTRSWLPFIVVRKLQLRLLLKLIALKGPQKSTLACLFYKTLQHENHVSRFFQEQESHQSMNRWWCDALLFFCDSRCWIIFSTVSSTLSFPWSRL